MTRYDKRVRALAGGLPALAGFVDAVAFVKLGGFFAARPRHRPRLAVARR